MRVLTKTSLHLTPLQLLVGRVLSAQPPLRARVRVALAIRAEHPPLSRALVDAPAPGREMARVWLELGLGQA